MFVCQSNFNMLELQKYKGTDYVIGWKSKGSFESKQYLVLSYLTKNIWDTKYE